MVRREKPCNKAVTANREINDGIELIRWKIDIKSLQDLYELINEVGRIIIDEDSIEIYDDYRE